MLFQGNL